MVKKEIAIIGPAGSGKTYLARLLISELKKRGVIANTTELVHPFLKSERTKGPAVLILETEEREFIPSRIQHRIELRNVAHSKQLSANLNQLLKGI